MAFAIELKINDRYLAALLRHKLSTVFNDAYIIGIDPSDAEEIMKMAEFKITLYDNRSYRPEDPMSIPIFGLEKNGFRYLSVASLCSQIRDKSASIDTSGTSGSGNGRAHILFPFSYIDDREKMIGEYFEGLRYEADHVIRIDLMSGLRMPAPIKTGPEAGSLTSLLRLSSSGKLASEDILQFCNPDLSGFLTPGRPQDPDDVFDSDPESIITLLKGLKELSIKGKDPDIATLAVIEGFKLSMIRRMIPHADTIHILLPSRSAEDSSGLGSIRDILMRELSPDQKLLIHYSEDYTRKEVLNDRTRI